MPMVGVMEALFVPLALAAGGLLPVQAGANAQLSRATGNAFAATTLQLAVGAAVLLVIAAATGALPALAALPQATWWHAIGGSASALYVVATILLFPRLGAVASVGLLIAGQMLASPVLDAFGLLGVPEQGFDVGSAGGAAAVLAGVVAIVVGQPTGSLPPPRAGWIALALAAGAVLPVQGAVNALLRVELQAPFAVGLTSFVVATVAMATVLAVSLSLGKASPPTLIELPRMPWWGWLGGFVGAAYVVTVFIAMPAIGAAATVGLTVLGQQVASICRRPLRLVPPAEAAGLSIAPRRSGLAARRCRAHQDVLKGTASLRIAKPLLCARRRAAHAVGPDRAAGRRSMNGGAMEYRFLGALALQGPCARLRRRHLRRQGAAVFRVGFERRRRSVSADRRLPRCWRHAVQRARVARRRRRAHSLTDWWAKDSAPASRMR